MRLSPMFKIGQEVVESNTGRPKTVSSILTEIFKDMGGELTTFYYQLDDGFHYVPETSLQPYEKKNGKK